MKLRQKLQRVGLWPKPNGARTLGRSILLAAIVGVVAGLGAIAFHVMCLFVTHYGIDGAANYQAGGPANETELHDVVPGMGEHGGGAEEVGESGGADDTEVGAGGNVEHEPVSKPIPWLLIAIPAIGGLVSGFLVFKFAPEAEGHGTDAAIRAYHHEGGFIRPRVPLIKMISSAITLGTGGSGGREGPIAQIGAGFGSYLATRLKLSDNERRLLMAAGLGAGIGAIFHAPLAGAIFAIEVLYRDPDFESEALIPAFIATTVSFSVFSIAFGAAAFDPLFHTPDLEFTRPLTLLLPLAVLAIAMAFAAVVYIKSFYGLRKLFQKMKKVPPFLRPVIGAGLSGVLALGFYYMLSGSSEAASHNQHDSLSVLASGYGYLQKILDPQGFDPQIVGTYSVAVLLIIGLGKIVTTGLTIGSGGSGGVFGPSMVIGGSLGALVGLVFHQILPDVVLASDIVIFAILGMAAFFAAAANTPVSTLIMVTEMTASYTLLMPCMWVCALAYLLKGRLSLYEEQVRCRIDSPAHRGDFIVDVLKGITVRDVITKKHREFMTVPMDMELTELSRIITSTTQTSFPVVNSEGDYYGLFSLQDIRQFLYESNVGALAVAQDLATNELEPLTMDMDLSDALTRFAQGHFGELPVVEAGNPKQIVGMARRRDVIAEYDRRLLEARMASTPAEC